MSEEEYNEYVKENFDELVERFIERHSERWEEFTQEVWINTRECDRLDEKRILI